MTNHFLTFPSLFSNCRIFFQDLQVKLATFLSKNALRQKKFKIVLTLYIFAYLALFHRLKQDYYPIYTSVLILPPSPTSSKRTETIFDTPDSCIVTPYKTSAASMVPFRCVTTINWVSSWNRLR